MGMILRGFAVVIAAVAVVILLWAPWDPDSGVSIALRAPPADPGAPFDDGTAPHPLIRYDMPRADVIPPLAEGTRDLDWSDLYVAGEFPGTGAQDRERLGFPSASEFPDGTTTQDIELFFLDIADMRSMQIMEGGLNESLDGARVRLAGYTTPVGFSEGETRFLLVPVLGACIHVPPPTPNQIVYVEEAAGAPEMFAPIWLEGTLRADPTPTILADAGYRLEDAVATIYR